MTGTNIKAVRRHKNSLPLGHFSNRSKPANVLPGDDLDSAKSGQGPTGNYHGLFHAGTGKMLAYSRDLDVLKHSQPNWKLFGIETFVRTGIYKVGLTITEVRQLDKKYRERP